MQNKGKNNKETSNKITEVRTGAFTHFGAFESTKLADTGTDILGTTHHIERWEYDLNLLLDASIRHLRYSIPWHRIETSPGVFDFEWCDGPLNFMRKNGMTPILDPLHHVSFPEWLTDGFANPAFPDLYTRFVGEIAKRYEWVDSWTIFNEPLPTTVFCSQAGWWPPFHASDREFVSMTMNVARAICRCATLLEGHNPDVRFFHMDTAEVHRAMDMESKSWVDFANERRFLFHDLILGRIDSNHSLTPYLKEHGASVEELEWIAHHRTRIDVLGLDYYIHSEMEWRWDESQNRAITAWPLRNCAGFAHVASDYVERFGLPVMLGETNLRGTVRDRLTWLKFMQEQCHHLAARSDFRGFCWYPSIDSTDWCNFCRKATGQVDPQGIWWLGDDRWLRHRSELSDAYAGLASGAMHWTDLPASEFTEDPNRNLDSHRKLMAHWPDWADQSERPEAA